MRPPTRCHLWQGDVLQSQDLRDIFEVVETFEDTSHFSRCLLRCTRCGQRYFYQFYETIDWEDGDDPQYSTYIPVDANEEVEILKKASVLELGQFAPRLVNDYPKGAQRPNVFWVGKE
jgi:hypothetical protein